MDNMFSKTNPHETVPETVSIDIAKFVISNLNDDSDEFDIALKYLMSFIPLVD